MFVLISDLYEGGVAEQLLARMAELRAAGVQAVTLLALSDSGAPPAYDRELAAQLVELGVPPSFACTPDAFPDLLAAALNGGQPDGLGRSVRVRSRARPELNGPAQAPRSCRWCSISCRK